MRKYKEKGTDNTTLSPVEVDTIAETVIDVLQTQKKDKVQ